MDYRFNRIARWTSYTSGVVFIALGAGSILHPFYAVASVAVLMGFGFLVAGINNLIPYVSMRNDPLRPKWLLSLAIVDLVFGLFFLSHLGLALFTLSSLLGAWLLATGLARAYTAFQIRAAGLDKWWLLLLSAAIMTIVSTSLFVRPFVAVVAVAVFAGVVLICVGLLSIAEGKFVYPPPPKKSGERGQAGSPTV